MNMYQENRQKDRTEREQLYARIEELSSDLAAIRLEVYQGDDESVNRGLRGHPQMFAWLSCCDHYFHHRHIPEEEKVEIASYHLDEDEIALVIVKISNALPHPPQLQPLCFSHLSKRIENIMVSKLVNMVRQLMNSVTAE
uniref:Uncharacterized protein n=1 Tax=Populus alba TaxID=43335 RepID=A0A4U5NP08_POPAL|nr:hypothetical protein D5086_0000248720 [Populus alba]